MLGVLEYEQRAPMSVPAYRQAGGRRRGQERKTVVRNKEKDKRIMTVGKNKRDKSQTIKKCKAS